ncbi:MAG: hypothetical protein MUC92_13565 [Fimbriimonadaceae bacterium]|jgi:hypothetical protein|nr:hypothetical protein [Fimbriimonadaceae bacterium]
MQLDSVIGGFLITLFSIPLYGFGLVFLIRKMALNEIEFIPGVIAILILLGMAGLTLSSPNPYVPGIMIVTVISLYATLPFAQTQLGILEFRRLNAEEIEKLIGIVATRPENHAAAFQLAEALYQAGFRGHAIALAENASANLDPTVNPVTMTSMKGFFIKEEQKLRRWKQQGGPPRLFAAVTCPHCKTSNEPGWVVCKKCRQPYLLETILKGTGQRRFLGRVLIAWILVAIVAPASAWIAVAFPGAMAALAIPTGLALIGLTLFWLFRAPAGDQTARVSEL